jgi:hypothetical protein
VTSDEGIPHGLTEGVSKALAADLIPVSSLQLRPLTAIIFGRRDFSMTTIYRMMARTRLLLAVLLCLAVTVPAFAAGRSGRSGGSVYVRGYTRRDGTYVQPHYRSAPDSNFYNNWSTKGNVNPYTGQEGTKVTPPSGYGGSYGSRDNRSTLEILRDYYQQTGRIDEFNRVFGTASPDPATRAYAARAALSPATPAEIAEKIYLTDGNYLLPKLRITTNHIWDTRQIVDGELRLPEEVMNNSPYVITKVSFKVCFFKDGAKVGERLVPGYSPEREHGRETTPLQPGYSGPFVIRTPQILGSNSVSVYLESAEGMPVRK